MSKVIQRSGITTDFAEHRIEAALRAAALSCSYNLIDKDVCDIVSSLIEKHSMKDRILDVETIQDMVIDALMERGLSKVAKQYIEYRIKRASVRDVEKNYTKSFYVKFPNSGKKKKKAAWIIAKISNLLFKHSKETENLLVKKISDAVLDSLNTFFKKRDVSLESLSDITKSACILNGIEKNVVSFFENNALSLTFWSESILCVEGLIKKLIDKTLLLPDSLVFSKKGRNSEVCIPKKHFIKMLDDINNQSSKNLSYAKERAYSAYKDGIDLYTFYSTIASIFVPHIDEEPDLAYPIARFLLGIPYLYVSASYCNEGKISSSDFKECVLKGIALNRLNPELAVQFDLDDLGAYVDHSRDFNFKYMGVKILIDRYLIKSEEEILETPQMLFMRVAMGISLGDPNAQEVAKKSYDLLSNFEYMPSTPTLFNSGTTRSQMSSCYLSTTADSLTGIMQSLTDNAMMSKWAGGLGTDWTYVRAADSEVKGTGGKSRGIIPFLKVMNSLCFAVNQGGKRKGAAAAYLEVWHKDIFAFIDLKKTTGDERMRTHDISHAVWVPDLFMQRVIEGKHWTLFCPSDAVGLHDLYGEEFEILYTGYEVKAAQGLIHGEKVIAAELYKKILHALFETGHPWITFKDPANVCYMQKHKGVIKSSNLCTEIFEHSTPNDIGLENEAEIGVCTLGSINLLAHIKEETIDWKRLENTVRHAVRMLDNCIDNNFYPVEAARTSTMNHRFIGLGQCGWHDALILLNVPFESEKMLDLTHDITEFVTYHAISASVDLAKERGSYPTFKGSEWSKGKVPMDMFDELAKYRKKSFLKDEKDTSVDWGLLRTAVKGGLRNALISAIAPTVTISPIMGVSDSVTPLFGVMYAKTNMSGSFVYISDATYKLLKKHGLWSAQLVEDLKYYDGSVQSLTYIPDKIKNLLKGAFEIDYMFVIRGAAIRQKFIDQGQSINLFFSHNNGKLVMDAYQKAFLYGLKSTYYMRSRSASTIEKATVDVNVKGVRPLWAKGFTSASNVKIDRVASKQCTTEVGCESCQ